MHRSPEAVGAKSCYRCVSTKVFLFFFFLMITGCTRFRKKKKKSVLKKIKKIVSIVLLSILRHYRVVRYIMRVSMSVENANLFLVSHVRWSNVRNSTTRCWFRARVVSHAIIIILMCGCTNILKISKSLQFYTRSGINFFLFVF